MRKVAILASAIMVPLLVVALAMAQPRPAKNFGAHLDGGNEVPERVTLATGQVIFQSNNDDTAITYKLIGAHIENVVQAHVHLGMPGVNGPVVAFLTGPLTAGGGRVDGAIAEGTITAANLVGPLAGTDLSILLTAMRTGGTYVHVRTDDGIAPANTGPGDFPGGEIRGQVQARGPE